MKTTNKLSHKVNSFFLLRQIYETRFVSIETRIVTLERLNASCTLSFLEL